MLVKCGNVTVRVYPTAKVAKGREYPAHVIAYYDEAGKRRLLTRGGDEKAVKAEARAIADRLDRGDVSTADASRADLDELARCRRIVEPTGAGIVTACSHYAEAVKILGRDLVIEAARDYSRRKLDSIQPLAVEAAVDKLVAARRSAGIGERRLADLESRLGRFAKGFQCQMADVFSKDVNEWLRGLGVSGKTRNHYRECIVTLIRFCIAEGYLPRTWEEHDHLESAKTKPTKVEILDPETMAAMLKTALPSLKPYLAIAAFAGLRQEEVSKLEWPAIDTRQGVIVVNAEAAKTAETRLVPILEPLLDWLPDPLPKAGRVCTLGNIPNGIARTAEKAGVTWKHNGPRHSWISSRLALIQNMAQVAEEAGNSPGIIKRNYRKPIHPDLARAWFNIKPEGKK